MADLVAEFRRSLKHPEVEEYIDLYFNRPLAFLLVKAVYRTRLTPNQLTLISLVLGLGAAACIGTGRPGLLPAAAALLSVSIIVDCSDGQLARLKKNGTPLGRLIDGSADYVVGIAMYAALGLALSAGSPRPALVGLAVAAAAASNIIHSTTFDHYQTRFLAVINGDTAKSVDAEIERYAALLEKIKEEGHNPIRRRAIAVYLRYTRFQKRIAAKGIPASAYSPEFRREFARRNHRVIRMWSLLGPSTQGLLLIAAALAGRLDLYLWAMIVLRNLWGIVAYAVQVRVTRRFEREVAPSSL
jgi:hypothetical protein